ncbi:hypothetical protein SAMN04487759_11439 [Kandleria vitulina]|jgi:hypothetical protein|uniref:Lipoprotein n=1 Tax=Kandleria vitulina TaxID=1630 RepID=A0A1H2TKI2_9FIRM|nr:hypothetical protein [Kandleria vitulina]SDL98972.1 hypothetical protein SAMN05216520_11917 [Kandleria vitulina]SDW44320.1 hypothetical protein SAMN04487759_11439 [Kandleria vitulina]HAH75561.1 hypothetical protein [Kandleria vitulina]
MKLKNVLFAALAVCLVGCSNGASAKTVDLTDYVGQSPKSTYSQLRKQTDGGQFKDGGISGNLASDGANYRYQSADELTEVTAAARYNTDNKLKGDAAFADPYSAYTKMTVLNGEIVYATDGKTVNYVTILKNGYKSYKIYGVSLTDTLDQAKDTLSKAGFTVKEETVNEEKYTVATRAAGKSEEKVVLKQDKDKIGRIEYYLNAPYHKLDAENIKKTAEVVAAEEEAQLHGKK